MTVRPADRHLCLPGADAVDSPLPTGRRDEARDAYDELWCAVEDPTRTGHEVTLLGSPTLFNPDLRRARPDPNEWMLLLEFHGHGGWLAGVDPGDGWLREPSFGSADYLQYFVRRSDYAVGRLDLGFLGYMLT